MLPRALFGSIVSPAGCRRVPHGDDSLLGAIQASSPTAVRVDGVPNTNLQPRHKTRTHFYSRHWLPSPHLDKSMKSCLQCLRLCIDCLPLAAGAKTRRTRIASHPGSRHLGSPVPCRQQHAHASIHCQSRIANQHLESTSIQWATGHPTYT